LGITRYGTALQPFNGRNAKLDLYEELLDAVMYLKQDLTETDELRSQLEEAQARLSEATRAFHDYVAEFLGGGA